MLFCFLLYFIMYSSHGIRQIKLTLQKLFNNKQVQENKNNLLSSFKYETCVRMSLIHISIISHTIRRLSNS